MSIQPLTSTPIQNGVRRESGQTEAAGRSFQDLMRAAGSELPSAEARSGHADMRSYLYEARLAVLENMERGKEKEEEEEAWDKLMEYVDAWIESLREEGDIEKTARAYAAVEALKVKCPAKRRDIGDWVIKMMKENLSGGFSGD